LNKKKTNHALPLIDIKSQVNIFQKVYLSKIARTIRYIALESDLIHPITWNTHFYADFSNSNILDSDGRVCLLYDNEGHFLRQVGSNGRGPGEYMGISSVFLIGEKVYIHDYFTDDLIEYKVDGTFVKRYNSGFTTKEKYRLEYNGSIMINDSLIFGHLENQSGQDEYKALIIDTQGQVRYYYKNFIFFNLKPGLGRAQSRGNVIIYKYKDEVFYKEPLNDTLFRINDQYQLNPSYVFDFGKYKEPLSETGKPWSQRDFSSYIRLSAAFQTTDYLILECNFGKYFPTKRLTPEIIRLPGHEDIIMRMNTSIVVGIYDKSTSDLVFSEPTGTDNHLLTSGLYNDFDGGPRFIPDKMVNDSTMVMKIRFDYLVELVKSDDFKNNTSRYPERKKQLEELVDSLRRASFDNPVYMFVTFKTK